MVHFPEEDPYQRQMEEEYKTEKLFLLKSLAKNAKWVILPASLALFLQVGSQAVDLFERLPFFERPSDVVGSIDSSSPNIKKGTHSIEIPEGIEKLAEDLAERLSDANRGVSENTLKPISCIQSAGKHGSTKMVALISNNPTYPEIVIVTSPTPLDVGDNFHCLGSDWVVIMRTVHGLVARQHL